jgi:hypothetical protein
VPGTVGLWSVGGTLAMLVIALRWPRPQAFDDEIALAAASAPEPPAPTPAAVSTPPRVPARSATHVTPRNG